jgi:Flp pilus assembly protein TadG
VIRSGLAGPKRLRRANRGGERGQSGVEFALVVPFLMLAVIGIIKFGTAYNNYEDLTHAVSAGARQFSIERLQSSPCTDAVGVLDASAAGLSTANIAITISVNGGTQWLDPPGTATCPTLTEGLPATLSATYPCPTSLFGVNFVPGCVLTASSTDPIQ